MLHQPAAIADTLVLAGRLQSAVWDPTAHLRCPMCLDCRRPEVLGFFKHIVVNPISDLAKQPWQTEGLAAGLGLFNELFQDHLLCLWVSVKAIKHFERINTESLVGHRPPFRVELGSKEVLVLRPHLASVCLSTVMQKCNPLVQLHELRLLQETIPVEVVQPKKLCHEVLDALRSLGTSD